MGPSKKTNACNAVSWKARYCIFWYFASNVHHKCRCKATMNQNVTGQSVTFKPNSLYTWMNCRRGWQPLNIER